MTAKPIEPAPEPRVTIDDLKHRVEHLKTQAVTEAKSTADVVLRQEATRTLMIAVGVVVVAASLAYFLGTRSGRAAILEQSGLE